MTTVFPSCVPIDCYDLATMPAGDFVVCFPVHLIQMSVPPLISALATAELSRLALWLLDNLRTAVLTGADNRRSLCFFYHRFLRRFLLCFFLTLLLSLVLCCMKFREDILLDTVIKEMHFCRSVLFNHDFINDESDVIFV